MGQLRFSGAYKRRHIGQGIVRDLYQFRARDGTDDKPCAGIQGVAAVLLIENGPGPNQRARAEFPLDVGNGGQSVWSGQRNFTGCNATTTSAGAKNLRD